MFVVLQVTLDEFAHAQSPVTHLATVPQPDDVTDILACAGHFNAVMFYQDGKVHITQSNAVATSE